MTIRRILLAIALGVAMITSACSGESQRPTAIAKIQIPPLKYADFVSSLDKALLKSGLTRFGAAPGLNEIYGREVFYFEYRSSANSKWAFITANDLVKVGVIELRLYSTAASLEKGREMAKEKLIEVLKAFGAELIKLDGIPVVSGDKR
jgi:hypothetical protein